MKFVWMVAMLAAVAFPRGVHAAGASAMAADTLKEQVIGKEREELESLKDGNYKGFADLLAEDAVFLDPRGSGTKAEVVEHSSGVQLLEFTMEDIHFVPLSESSGLVAYKLREKGRVHGHEFAAVVYASALWAQRSGKWVCLFSQETPAREVQPH